MKFYRANNGLNPPISLQKDGMHEGFNPPNSAQSNIEKKGFNPPKTSQPITQPPTPNKTK